MDEHNNQSKGARICQTCGAPLEQKANSTLCLACVLAGEITSVEKDACQLGEIPRFLCSYLMDLEAEFVSEAESATRFEDPKQLAAGGQGEVYLVTDRRLGRQVALKRIHAASAEDNDKSARFLREAQIAARLNHPGVLSLHDVCFTDEGVLYYTMTHVKEGQTLGDFIASIPEGPQRIQRLVEIMIRVCETLAYAHEQEGLVHRDLKPANIMVGRFGEVFVIDWGAAGFLARGDEYSPNESDSLSLDSLALASPVLTQTSGRPRTIPYTPPEVFDRSTKISGKLIDVYAVGVIFYELLTNRHPHHEEGDSDVSNDVMRERIMRRSVCPLSDRSEAVPKKLAAIVDKAMASDPKCRYASMEALEADLRNYQDNRVVEAYDTGFLAIVSSLARRYRWQLWLVIALGVASISGGSYVALRHEVGRERTLQVARDALNKGRLAMSDGNWGSVVEFLDAARVSGEREPVAVEFFRAESLSMTAKRSEARRVFEALMERPDLGEYRARVMLRLAELELFDWHDSMEPEQTIRTALDLGLPDAERAYAQGLLSESTEGAMSFLDKTLGLAPRHHGARLHRIGLNLFAGNQEGLESDLAVFEALYPNDQTPRFARALAASFRGDAEEAQRLMTDEQGGMDPKLIELAQQALGFSGWLNLKFGPDSFFSGGLTQESGDFLRLIGFLKSLDTYAKSGGLGSIDGMFPGLPSLRNGLMKGMQAVASLSVGQNDEVVRALKDAVTFHEDGFLLLVLAVKMRSLIDEQATLDEQRARLLEADRWLELATESGSFLADVRRPARFFSLESKARLLWAEYELTRQERQKWQSQIEGLLKEDALYRPEFEVGTLLVRELKLDALEQKLALFWNPSSSEDRLLRLESLLNFEWRSGNRKAVARLLETENAAERFPELFREQNAKLAE